MKDKKVTLKRLLQSFLKPAKMTWIVFFIIITLLIFNVFSLNIFGFGSEHLFYLAFFLPLKFFNAIGLDVIAKHSDYWIKGPNLLGVILIILSDIVSIYFISLVITKILKIKDKIT